MHKLLTNNYQYLIFLLLFIYFFGYEIDVNCEIVLDEVDNFRVAFTSKRLSQHLTQFKTERISILFTLILA